MPAAKAKKSGLWKLDAAGNRFVLLDARPPAGKKAREESVRSLCARERVDGAVYVWTERKSWQWRFFNLDGGEVEICGNAARALPLWLRDSQRVKGPLWKWRGKLGLFQARVGQDGNFEVTWPSKNFRLKKLPGSLMEQLRGFNDHGLAGAYLVNVGNPHLVMINHEIWSPQIRQANNTPLRQHSAFGKAGANVTWLSLKGRKCVTFERGVEGETAACGSGALAAFLALGEYEKSFDETPRNTALFQFPGGALRVTRDGPPRSAHYWLGGPAKMY